MGWKRPPASAITSSACTPGSMVADSPVLVRYADDLVALCHSRDAGRTRSRPGWRRGWRPEGLAFNEDKTQIVHLDEGFDFSGVQRPPLSGKAADQTVQSGPASGTGNGSPPRCRPCEGPTSPAVIQRLNPIIRGWSAYYRTAVSTRGLRRAGPLHVAAHLQVGHATATRTSRSDWVIARYFGAFHKSRRDRWVFGDRDSGAYLLKHSWTRIVRHQMVPGRSSPDDPTWPSTGLSGGDAARPRWTASPWACFGPNEDAAQSAVKLLLFADQEPQTLPEWEQWLTVTRKAVRKQAITAEQAPGPPDDPVAVRLVHAECRPQATHTAVRPS